MNRIQKKRKAVFFSFEGIDGSGKSVQAESLLKALKNSGYKTTLFREPGGTGISEQIRKILLDNNNTTMTPLTELLLYEASRAQLVTEKIEPLLGENGVIIADRFFDSTTAYQGYGRSISLQKIEALNNLVCKNTIPDRTYILNISWEESLKRRSIIPSITDRMENQAQEFYSKISNGFAELAQKHPQRIIILDGEQSQETVKKIILEDALKIIEKKLSQHI